MSVLFKATLFSSEMKQYSAVEEIDQRTLKGRRIIWAIVL